ncbi:MAG: ABC transporter ATP-binding protein [Acidobacteriota bacterium]|nr:ABC transporter ATP-binding protein [Acidobacteriota bacterium]
MSGTSPAIVLEGVSFAYAPGRPLVLREVGYMFKAGAVTALLGPNGSGKTTLLNLILGWLRPGAGRILVSGLSARDCPRGERGRRIGLVPQNEAPAFDLELFEYVLLGRAPYLGLLERPGEADREAALAALEKAGIAELAERPVRALSGGEKQLGAIARAVAQDPAILLLDEPTSHLDLANTRRVLRLLDALRAGGKTILLTTHDPNTAAALADEAVLLKSGRVIAAGPPAEVLNEGDLSRTYGVTLDVRMIDGRPVVLNRL